MKIFQCLAVYCTYLHYYSFNGSLTFKKDKFSITRFIQNPINKQTDKERDTEFFTTGTFCGFVVILTVILAGELNPHMFSKVSTLINLNLHAGYLIKATASKRIFVLYSLFGAVLFLSSGVFTLQIWERAFHNSERNLAMSKSVVAIINGAIFLMDTIFTFLQSK